MRERQEEEEKEEKEEGDELPKPFSLSGCALDYVVYAEQGGWHWTLAAHDINHFSLEALSKQRDDGDDDFQNGGYQNSLVHVAAHPNGHRLPISLALPLSPFSLSLSQCLPQLVCAISRSRAPPLCPNALRCANVYTTRCRCRCLRRDGPDPK